MKRITLILAFLTSMILFSLYIMNLGYLQGDNELLYLGLGLPFWFYMFYFYLRLMNRINVKEDSVILKNIILGEKTIIYSDIDQWEEIETIRIKQRNLLIRTKGKKITISNMSDEKNYETLKAVLKIHWAKSENILYL